ncbi:hypothetical protein [Streptomyces sp. D54]|uniref:hypothetical protein n=1 Tax=Streptomyces sp. D54 TaxID=1290289 RepID=UPI003CF07941
MTTVQLIAELQHEDIGEIAEDAEVGERAEHRGRREHGGTPQHPGGNPPPSRQREEESDHRAAQEPARDPRRQPVAADVLEGRVLRVGIVGAERKPVPAEGR